LLVKEGGKRQILDEAMRLLTKVLTRVFLCLLTKVLARFKGRLF
jgi:hypothetical protein